MLRVSFLNGFACPKPCKPGNDNHHGTRPPSGVVHYSFPHARTLTAQTTLEVTASICAAGESLKNLLTFWDIQIFDRKYHRFRRDLGRVMDVVCQSTYSHPPILGGESLFHGERLSWISVKSSDHQSSTG
ncbi:LOW QUALITY PROTEIN: hypothetical protein V2J09_004138 [Rumex salicifolius]